MKKIYKASYESLSDHVIPKWYNDCKLGIFVHWGIYSVPAYAPMTCELGEINTDENWFCNNPYAEWYYNSVNVGKGPVYEYHMKHYGRNFMYDDFIPLWKAEKWDPYEWARIFKKSGAGYAVLTCKHHDGFCLFPSAYTDYNSANMGPCRDIAGEFCTALREEGIKAGLYYSSLVDWKFGKDPIYFEEQLFDNASPTYEYADYSYKQITELVDTYKPSLIWNDIGWPKQGEHNLPYFLSHYYNTVKDAVVNDRFNGLYKDFSTKEYKQGTVSRNEKWEMCRGMGLSFGYNKNEDESYIISNHDLIKLLVETVANNGNLLINIGPKADGTIPDIQKERLLSLGKWLEKNGEGIYGTRVCDKDILQGSSLYMTQKSGNIYVYCDVKDLKTNTFSIKGEYRNIRTLDEDVKIEILNADEKTTIKILNLKEDMNFIGFCILDAV